MLDLVNRPTPVVDSLPEAPPPLPELLAGPAPPPAVRKREVGQLIVVVLRAQHLDEMVKSPLCTVELTESPGGVEPTRVDRRDPQNPVWDEEFRFVVHAAETTRTPSEPLLVKIRDRRSSQAGDDQLVGQGQVFVVDSKTWVRNKDTGTYEFDGMCCAPSVQVFRRCRICAAGGKVQVGLNKDPVIADWVQLQKDGKFAGEVFLEMTFYPAIYLPNTNSATGPSTRPASTLSVPSSLMPGSRPQSHMPSGPQAGSYMQHPPTLVGQMSSLSIPEQPPQQESSSPSRRPLPSPPGATSLAYPQRQSYGSGAVGTEVGVRQPPPHDRHPQSSPSLENIGTVVANHMLQHLQPNSGLQHQMPQYQHAHQVQHQHQAQSQHFQPQLQQQQQQQMDPQQYRRTIQQQHQQLHREHLQQYQHMYQPSYPASDQPERSSDPQPPQQLPDQSSTHRNSDAHSPSSFASSSRIDPTQSHIPPSPSLSPGSFSSEPPPRPPKTPYNAPSPVASTSPVASSELVAPPPRHGSLPPDSTSTSTSRMSSLELSPSAEASTHKSKGKGKQKSSLSPSSPSPSPSLKTITQSLHLPSSSTASTSSATGSSAKPSTTKSRSIDPVLLADQARSLFRFQQEQEDARLAALLAEEARVAEDQVRMQKAMEDEEVVKKMLEEEEKLRVEEEKRDELMARQWEERERKEKEERERRDEELLQWAISNIELSGM